VRRASARQYRRGTFCRRDAARFPRADRIDQPSSAFGSCRGCRPACFCGSRGDHGRLQSFHPARGCDSRRAYRPFRTIRTGNRAAAA